ncbi:hypothetical protein [Streptacidiphilus sp. EB129]|uniref:hypothetical protein n=1 Tax=Streptacidiphilus sp. EB129 TaxID=3156262 RepID=UPI003515BD97
MKAKTAHRWWLCNAILWSALIVPAHVLLAVLGAPGGWLLILSVPLAVLNWCAWRGTRIPKPTPPVAELRTARFPAGRACPPGCCPICGMDDPVSLEACWGGLMAHQDCADWLGMLPQLDREQQREMIHHFPGVAGVTLAEASANLLTATESLGRRFPRPDAARAHNGRTCGCWDCFAIRHPIPDALIQKPQPPPGPGAGSPTAR